MRLFVLIIVTTKLIIEEAALAVISQNDASEDALLSCGNIVFQLFNHIHIQPSPENCQAKLSVWLQEMNEDILNFNVKVANLDWNISVGANVNDEGPMLDESRSRWRKNTCVKIANIDEKLITENQKRQLHFICRGAFSTPREAEIVSNILNEMQTIYTTSKICIPFVNASQIKEVNTCIMEKAILSYLRAFHLIYSASENAYLNHNSIDWSSLVSDVEDGIPNSVLSLASQVSSERPSRLQESNEICFQGEPDLERIMAHSRNEYVLRWSWLTWREKVGPPLRPFFTKMVSVKNAAAQRSGYSDVGEIWREELEIPNIESEMDKLYNEINDLYIVLHGVARFFLRQYYGPEIVSEKGPIPAHILGNMWAQSWEGILDLIMPQAKYIDLNKSIKSTKWTTHEMLKRAEDFYTSMGLPPMTKKFWNFSYFGKKAGEPKNKKEAKCHGTAANMFVPNDFRMIYCAGLSMEDFYVLHHEMGHIEYYMAYDEELPVIFQDGANSAFQESIGDAIMYGMFTPQHLVRLGLINDNLIYNQMKPINRRVAKQGVQYEIDDYKIAEKSLHMLKREKKISNTSLRFQQERVDDEIDIDSILLLRQALSKIPQIPYGYIIDKYRWDIFSGKIKANSYNKEFWNYVKKYQGLEPPNNEERSENYFDAAAKFHVADNTPYVRYFLSSFLSADMYRAMCQWSLFNKAAPELELPMPLHRCDIYGSKVAGKKLREMMSKGNSVHWSESLFILTGGRNITSSAIRQYFAPLNTILLKLIHKHNIPLGW